MAFSFFPSVLTVASALILAIANARSASFSIFVLRGSSGMKKSSKMPMPSVMIPGNTTLEVPSAADAGQTYPQ